MMARLRQRWCRPDVSRAKSSVAGGGRLCTGRLMSSVQRDKETAGRIIKASSGRPRWAFAWQKPFVCSHGGGCVAISVQLQCVYFFGRKRWKKGMHFLSGRWWQRGIHFHGRRRWQRGIRGGESDRERPAATPTVIKQT